MCLPGAMPLVAHAQAATGVTVLMPDIDEPFRGILLRIIEGIGTRVPGRLEVMTIGPTPPADLASELRRRSTRVVVALGRQGLKVIAMLPDSVKVVAGCVVSVQESEIHGYPVYSLAPDPGLLFNHLRELIPSSRRVTVVIDPRQNAWLVRRAREAAQTLGLELVAHETEELPAALRLYPQILRASEPSRDALWLPQDSTTVVEDAVLPLVLKESWAYNVAVFSSQLSHVKRGALFALYPDEKELGRTMGEAAVKILSGAKTAEGMLPLRDVRTAINTRSASHLGIQMPLRTAYDLVFPVP
ncbi:MAG TPA: ABC transporter substrate binding protein [Burkholderiaceae bacterium]|nr:ABC transporter substrate binding protein [Burkholderiaceae bacterium]